MRGGRRGLLALGLGLAALCLWCSFLSGVAGWIVGGDIARREARAGLGGTAAAEPSLPDLGVLVTRLDRGGPADAAGVLRGDVIVALNGTSVQDARDLRDQLLAYQPGETVRLTLLRDDGGSDEVVAQLAPFPGDARRPYLGVYYTARGEEPADL